MPFCPPDLGPAMGPLTQATGPPRSCGGVAICMLRGNPVLTGYSMLDDALGSRTNRLSNVGWFPRIYLLKVSKTQKSETQIWDSDLRLRFETQIWDSDLRLRLETQIWDSDSKDIYSKYIFNIYIQNIYIKNIYPKNKFKNMRLRFETQIWDSDFEFFETHIC